MGFFKNSNNDWNWSMGKALYVLGSVYNSKSTKKRNLIYHKWSPNAWTKPRGSRERKCKNDLKLEERGDEIPWVMILNRQRSSSRDLGEFRRVLRVLESKWGRRGFAGRFKSQRPVGRAQGDRYAGLEAGKRWEGQLNRCRQGIDWYAGQSGPVWAILGRYAGQGRQGGTRKTVLNLFGHKTWFLSK